MKKVNEIEKVIWKAVLGYEIKNNKILGGLSWDFTLNQQHSWDMSKSK